MHKYTYQVSFNCIVLISSLSASDLDVSSQVKAEIQGNPIYQENPLAIHHYPVHNAEGLKTLIRDLITEAEKGMKPIINFDCHGDETHGLILADQSTMLWEDLAECLRPLNEACEFNLMTLFSCCFGAHFIGGMGLIQPAPCAFMMGPTHKIYEDELIAALRSFFGCLLETKNIVEAVRLTRLRKNEFADWYSDSAVTWHEHVINGYLENHCSRVPSRKRVESNFHRYYELGYDKLYGVKSMGDIKRDLAKANSDGIINKYFDIYFMIDKIPSNKSKFEFRRQETIEYINSLKKTGKYLL